MWVLVGRVLRPVRWGEDALGDIYDQFHWTKTPSLGRIRVPEYDPPTPISFGFPRQSSPPPPHLRSTHLSFQMSPTPSNRSTLPPGTGEDVWPDGRTSPCTPPNPNNLNPTPPTHSVVSHPVPDLEKPSSLTPVVGEDPHTIPNVAITPRHLPDRSRLHPPPPSRPHRTQPLPLTLPVDPSLPNRAEPHTT